MIKIENVSFNYDEAKAAGLDDISLHIKRGQFVLLTGASGSGKTTLTRLINGLIPHFYYGNLKGTISIDGLELDKWGVDELSTKVGSVFQNPRSQFFNLDTTSEIAFGCENLGWHREKIHETVKKTVEDLGIAHLLGKNIFSLSGGEKQMVAIASAYVMGVDIFIMDEPSANLDSAATEKLAQILTILKAQGKTVIISEHRLYYLKGIVDRVVYLERGSIKEEWSGEEFSKLSNEERVSYGLRSYDLKKIKLKHKPLQRKKETDFFVEDLWTSYRNLKPILCGISCNATAGQITAVIGKNGCGKSTFARCLCGLLKEKKGKVQFHDSKLGAKERIGEIYLVMQDSTCQLFSDSVMGELVLSGKMKKNSSDEFEEVLKELSLMELKSRHPMSLSGGEKQRLTIAAGIIQNADIMILDEPTSGLDYRNMQRVKAVMEKLRNKGKRIFVITHDYELLLSTCDRVLEIEKGKISKDYPVDSNHLHYIRQFFLDKRKENVQ